MYKVTGRIQNKSGKIDLLRWHALSVRIFAKTSSSKKLLEEIPIDDNGLFTWQNDVSGKTSVPLLFELCLRQNGNIKNKFDNKKDIVATSGPHYLQSELSVQFAFDLKEHVVWFKYIEELVKPHLGRKKTSNLKPEVLEELSCLTCIDERDLREWQQAYIWAGDCYNQAKICWEKSKQSQNQKDIYLKQCQEAFEQLASLPLNILAEVFFPFAQNGQSSELAQVLTASESQLTAQLQSAVSDKLIAFTRDEKLVSILPKILCCLRDCLLLNTEYDELFYDAKLIAMADFSGKDKHLWLDGALTHGSLLGYISEGADFSDNIFPRTNSNRAKKSKSINNKQLPEIQRILLWDGLLEHFPPLLAYVTQEVREKKWRPYEMLNIPSQGWVKYITELTGKNAPQYPKKYVTADKPLQQYAQNIAQNIAQQFATEHLRDNLKASSVPNKSALEKILKKAPDFVIEKQAVSRHFSVAEKPVEPNELSEKEFEKIQRLQRCVKIAGGVQDTKLIAALMRSGMDSAKAIVKVGNKRFQQKMTKYGFSEDIHREYLEWVYCRAKVMEDIAASTTFLLKSYEGK